jgi:hypothetical protein
LRNTKNEIVRIIMHRLIFLLSPFLVVGVDFTVSFPDDGPLGLQFDSSLRVFGFARSATGAPLAAELSRWLRRGDVLEKVNGDVVRGRPLSDVTAVVASASRPRNLTFSAEGDRAAEMSARGVEGASGIHGHEGILQLASRSGGKTLGHTPFLQATFGGQLSCASAPLIAAVPKFGCGAYARTMAPLAFGAIIVVERGACAFSDKAAIAQAAGAVGLVVLNDPGNSFVRMPIDPIERTRLDLTLAVVMIDAGPAADALRVMLNMEVADGVSALQGRRRHESNVGQPTEGPVDGLYFERPAPQPVGSLEARLLPSGLSCSPWRLASESAALNGQKTAGMRTQTADDRTKSGVAYIFPPFSRVGGASRAPAAPEVFTVHSSSHEDKRVAAPSLYHAGSERTGFGVPDRAQRGLAGGSRARRALDQVARDIRDEAVDREALHAVIDSNGEVFQEDQPLNSVEAFDAQDALIGHTARVEVVGADFGGPLPSGKRLRLLQAAPINACAPLIGGGGVYTGTAVLANRGGCSFSEKARNVAHAGGSILLLASDSEVVFAMSSGTNAASEMDTYAPSAMVSRASGDVLRGAVKSAAGGLSRPLGGSATDPALWADASVLLVGDASVAEAWAELSKLLDPRAWPADALARKKTYTRLARQNHPDREGGSQERFELLAFLYRRSNHHFDPKSEPHFQDAPVPIRDGM